MYLQEGFRASKIIDQTVKNAQGEELSEVDDLIMSRNGKTKKVILSVGGFLGIGDRLVAVPFKSLQISEKGGIVYNVTKQQLENHPVFNYGKEGLYEYYYAAPLHTGRLVSLHQRDIDGILRTESRPVHFHRQEDKGGSMVPGNGNTFRSASGYLQS